ncbi:MAG: hypothetical protein IKV25_07505 [Clostridia bacterium]|nr:hypothetical protein [Clostridia bacterium]
MNNNNFDEIINSVKSQDSQKETEDFLKKKLNPSQTKKLKEVMSDKGALEQLLSTPQAKALLKKFMEAQDD